MWRVNVECAYGIALVEETHTDSRIHAAAFTGTLLK